MDTRLINITYPPCVHISLKLEDVSFYILGHGTIYDILQVESYNVYMDICQVAVHTKTEHAFVYDRNHTTFGGDIGCIYFGIFIDDRNYSPIRSFENITREQFRYLGK